MATGTVTNEQPFSTKYTGGSLSVPASDIATTTYTVNDSIYHAVTGFSVASTTNVVVVQAYFSASNTITVRVKNVISSAQTCYVTIYYT